MSSEASPGAILTVDLGAIAANWRKLQEMAAPAACGAVVKADAYGLGLEAVAGTLAQAGCRQFFTATLEEGIALRGVLGPGADIAVFHGLVGVPEAEFVHHGLVPVLNSLDEIAAWDRLAAKLDRRLAAAIHLDTGMSRLGLPPADSARLAAEPERLARCSLRFAMSHLACADEPENPMNDAQLAAFAAARARLPAAPGCLAASSGIFLGPRFHLDLVRPGAALFGLPPHAQGPNPMRQVVVLKGKILQVRDVDSPGTVGYGATHRVVGTSRLATVAVGYADGYLRALGNHASGVVGGVRVPLVGRVSMDLITFDVTLVPQDEVRPGGFVDLIGPEMPPERLAEDAGTIGYEILAALGPRFARRYIGSAG